MDLPWSVDFEIARQLLMEGYNTVMTFRKHCIIVDNIAHLPGKIQEAKMPLVVIPKKTQVMVRGWRDHIILRWQKSPHPFLKRLPFVIEFGQHVELSLQANNNLDRKDMRVSPSLSERKEFDVRAAFLVDLSPE